MKFWIDFFFFFLNVSSPQVFGRLSESRAFAKTYTVVDGTVASKKLEQSALLTDMGGLLPGPATTMPQGENPHGNSPPRN